LVRSLAACWLTFRHVLRDSALRTDIPLHVITHAASVAMLHLVFRLVLFSYVQVANSDLSRVKAYPPRHDRPSTGPGRVHPLPAVPLPNYVLMTASSTGEFQPDNDLEVTHDFKLRIEAGREMCMFQRVRQNARLYVSFKVSH